MLKKFRQLENLEKLGLAYLAPFFLWRNKWCKMLSHTWKPILHLRVTQVVKELKFNHFKSMESLNRKNYFILNLHKRLQMCALLAFSRCICLVFIKKKSWFTCVSKKYHSSFTPISWMPLSAAKILNQQEMDFFFYRCITSLLIFSSTYYKKKLINSLCLMAETLKHVWFTFQFHVLSKGNETEERRFLPSADTLVSQIWPTRTVFWFSHKFRM